MSSVNDSADNPGGVVRERHVTWYDPATLSAAASSMPGLELLQAIIEGQLPRPPIASLFGAELVSVTEGVAVFRCTPDESTYNPIGVVHGGFLCTLLDTAAGCAVHTLLPAGTGFGSIEIKVSFLKPLTARSGVIEIRGEALRMGSRVAFAQAHARNGDDELVGHATTSIALIRSARPAPDRPAI